MERDKQMTLPSARAGRAGLERRTGVALWRQIADRIRSEFIWETSEAQLPPETELATRFGVNRHTVRAAISALVGEGALRSEQGRGTFVVRRRRLAYPIARRTRFSAGLEGQALERRSRMLGHGVETATDEIATALSLAPGAKVIRVESLGEADGAAVSRATSWYDPERFPNFPQIYARTESVTAALAELGVTDYFRSSTVVEARHADAADIADLALSPGAVVLVTRAVNTDPDGAPIQYSITRFAADRVELRIDYPRES